MPHGITLSDGSAAIAADPRDHKGVAHELARCLLVDPRNASSHYNLGVALLMEGSDQEQANAEFRRALELKPDYEDARKALDAMRK